MDTPTIRERVGAALAALDDTQLDAAIRALGDGEHLNALAQALNLKKPTISAHPSPSSIVRPRAFSGPPGRRALAALAIAGPCSDDCIDRLGDASDNPARSDMEGVLDGLVQSHGLSMVALMLAAYPAIDAPCAGVFNELLDTDQRFAISDASYATAKDLARAHIADVDEPALDARGLAVAHRERDARIAADAARLKKSKTKPKRRR